MRKNKERVNCLHCKKTVPKNSYYNKGKYYCSRAHYEDYKKGLKNV